MSDKYLIYAETCLHSSQKEKTKLLALSGCNETRHILKIIKEFFDKNEEVEKKFLVTNIDLGLCDKQCADGYLGEEFEEKGQTISIPRPTK